MIFKDQKTADNRGKQLQNLSNKIGMGYSRKNPHLPDGWDSGNSHRRGGQRLWRSRREGGLNLRRSSAGVISTDSSRDSNV